MLEAWRNFHLSLAALIVVVPGVLAAAKLLVKEFHDFLGLPAAP
jgi:hypothetical protein